MRPDRGQNAMTFAELLAAMTIIAIVMPVMVGAVLFANRTAVMGSRRAEAAWQADQLMQEAIATGTWQDGDEEGELSNGMTWRRETDDWDVEALSTVTVSVDYTVQGTVYTESVVRAVRVPEAEE
ncbi:hypothetical protein GC173_05850 [bacterium]|nr:hypothetical protein [bacterium]